MRDIELTDARIKALRECPKQAKNQNPREKKDRQYHRIKYLLEDSGNISKEHPESFTLFVRRNANNVEDFSCGLVWHIPAQTRVWHIPDKSTIILIRYNGPEHSHTNTLENEKLPQAPHIHNATQRYIQEGKPVDEYAKITDRYTDWQGALACLIQDCRVSGLPPQVFNFSGEPYA